MEIRKIYADNAATTRLSPTALEAMLPWLTDDFGNPSSIYGAARVSRIAIESARADMAACLGADPKEIYFTSGGTESDNWAIKGVAATTKKRRIVISNVEHHAVSESAHALERFGFAVTEVAVDEQGILQPAALEAALDDDVALVSIMLVNNELGTIMPIKELAEIAHAHGALFHTDAVQAVGHIPVDVKALGVDMLSLSAHKFHGPKGCGAFYLRSGLRIANLIDGGGHERRRRSGTENVASICGMAAALGEQCANMDETNARLTVLRDRLFAKLEEIPYSRVTGSREHRTPGCVSMVFEAIEGEGMILGLDALGIQASSGSACTSGSLDPSHVLLAIGLPHAIAHGSLRLSLGEDITEADVDYLADSVKSVVNRLRSMSPVWDSVAGKPMEL